MYAEQKIDIRQKHVYFFVFYFKINTNKCNESTKSPEQTHTKSIDSPGPIFAKRAGCICSSKREYNERPADADK